ncbi:MAG: hypothetical protein P4L36_09290 [Holophaga sp.]|nr:hypothetical protein [Holophaga sp.]
MRRRSSGLTLVELVVALAFMALLLGGMVRVYLAHLAGWNRVNQSLTAQRAVRWAMDRIAGDLRGMGCLFPPPELRTLPVAAGADPGLQGGFMLVPGQRGGNPSDQLSFILDAALPVRVRLEHAVTGGDPAAELQLRPARDLDLAAGDLVLVAGERFEFAQVASPVELAAGRAGPVPVVRPGGAAGAAFGFPHQAGAWVQVVRPLRLVCYAVMPLALEYQGRSRDGGGQRVPCLVRFETAYPADRAPPRWERFLKPAHRGEASHEVLAENVTRFRVDFSPDPVFPGIRGATWAETAGNLATRLQGRRGREGLAFEPSDPLWFRHHGGVLEVELETGSPEGPPGAPRAVLRSQTLRLAPRNFGL